MSRVQESELALGFGLSSVSAARHWAAARCAELTGEPAAGGDGPGPTADLQRRVELVTTELVANAVEHGAPPLRIGLRRTGDVLRVHVADGSRAAPVRREQPPDATSGRGIALVAHLSTGWGVEHVAGGKVVWCDVPLRKDG
ncbi:hypothetical protein NUM3379_36650 [Kineococcus sp. NUM-3379]